MSHFTDANCIFSIENDYFSDIYEVVPEALLVSRICCDVIFFALQQMIPSAAWASSAGTAGRSRPPARSASSSSCPRSSPPKK